MRWVPYGLEVIVEIGADVGLVVKSETLVSGRSPDRIPCVTTFYLLDKNCL